ncbi:MAG: FKBP-type peptidyl-prolyl cis-trans isomerase [Bacteroidia bacterium]
MKNLSIPGVMLMALFAFNSCEDQKAGSDPEKVTLNTSLDSLSYSIGISIGSNMNQQGLDSLDVDLVAAAMRASIQGDTNVLINMQEAGQYIQNQMQAATQRQQESSRHEGQAFLEDNRQKEDVQVTASGLQYKIMEEGSGARPGANDTVRVHYEGRLTDGKVFDSSIERGEPAQFPVNGVIPGWTEALKLMKEGAKWQLYIPSDLAYGERGAGADIPPHSVLIFDVELLKVIPGE